MTTKQPPTQQQPCGEPISFLTLERLALGELSGEKKERAEAHLKSCASCMEALDQIRAGDKRELRRLPRAKVVVVRGPWFTRPPMMMAAGFVLAAAIVLVIRTQPKPNNAADDRIKGTSDVGFTLVRDDDAVLPEAGGPYRDGERFKALVTCPPGLRGSFDLVVFEPNAPPSFPLTPALDLACGNAVPLAGAFRVTGHEPITVCLVWQTADTTTIIDRAMLSSRASLPAHAQCKQLEPAK